MSEIADIIDAYTEKHDALREVFFPEDIKFFLLEIDGNNAPYKLRQEITAGAYLKYSEFKGFFKLRYATQNANFKKELKLSSHVLIGTDVYEIDESETIKPMGSKPFWTIACKSTGEEFTSGF